MLSGTLTQTRNPVMLKRDKSGVLVGRSTSPTPFPCNRLFDTPPQVILHLWRGVQGYHVFSPWVGDGYCSRARARCTSICADQNIILNGRGSGTTAIWNFFVLSGYIHSSMGNGTNRQTTHCKATCICFSARATP